MIFQFGVISDPFARLGSSLAGSKEGSGAIVLANSLLKFAIVMAGLFAFWNFIAAGYGFMSAGDDAKAMGKAWGKFTQSLLGLLFVAGSFVLAAIFGWLIFGDATAILRPVIYSPTP
jgi:hypothetical protein